MERMWNGYTLSKTRPDISKRWILRDMQSRGEKLKLLLVPENHAKGRVIATCNAGDFLGIFHGMDFFTEFFMECAQHAGQARIFCCP